MNEELAIEEILKLFRSMEQSLKRIADAVEKPTINIDEHGDRV